MSTLHLRITHVLIYYAFVVGSAFLCARAGEAISKPYEGGLMPGLGGMVLGFAVGGLVALFGGFVIGSIKFGWGLIDALLLIPIFIGLSAGLYQFVF
jgi:hypothetical protein